MENETVNIVQLLCDLSEASDEVFRETAMGLEIAVTMQHLTKLGAIEPGPRPETVTCNACYADHPAVIEYDADRRCYVHFCPEAGFVTVNDSDLITHRFRPEWLVDWLVKALPITSPLRRPALIPGRVWHLGDAACGDTLVTVVFARRISSQAALDQLASVLGTIHHADKGLVITTSPQVARQVQLPHGFAFLDLREIGRTVGQRLFVDQARLGSLVHALPGKSSLARPVIKASRKSARSRPAWIFVQADKTLIAEMRAMIWPGTARNPTDAARALARRAAG